MAIAGGVPRLTRCVAALRPGIRPYRPRSLLLSARTKYHCLCCQPALPTRCPATVARQCTTRHLSSGAAQAAASPHASVEEPAGDRAAALATQTKHVFAAYPQPICLVLARDRPRASAATDSARGDAHRRYGGDDDDDVRGMTISSLTSLSLDPPLVTFNVKLPSRAYDAMIAASASPTDLGGATGFAVHFLGDSETEVAVARHYAGIPPAPAPPTEEDPARHIDHAAGVPMLRPEASAGAVLRCIIDRSVRVADHAIVVARIEEVVRPASTASNDAQSGGTTSRPLVYHRHAFTTIKTNTD